MRTNIHSLLVSLALLATFGPSALAQTIIPDNPATQVTTDSAQTTITGGTQSGSNLFHSFQQFNLDAGQTATFQAPGSIANIFSRITGGLPSLINGRLQIQGAPANLFLINPAGILFGTTATINLPAAFTATTAQGIEFGPGQWLSSATTDYSKLTSAPTGFGLSNAGAIANAGNLSVAPTQSLTLLGGTVLNTGTITAPGGTITIAALPGDQHVRLTPAGQVLSLDLPLSDKTAINPAPLTPQQLPELLTGQRVQNATQLTVENGQVRLTSSKVFAANPGDAIVSGSLSTVAEQNPSQINITGERIQLQEANIDASANFKAGKIAIGGDFQGKGETYRAKTVQIDEQTQIHADSKRQGKGGEIAIWSDGSTQFAGTATARGGTQGGDGGKIETSGKQTLNVQNAQVNAGATVGKNGEWLLDPTDINIANTGGTATPGAIATTLDTGTNVTLSTAGAGADAGDIKLSDSINQIGNGTAQLTLTGRRFTNPSGAQINLTSTGNLTFNLNLKPLHL
jgi:filamentous hemagglutinin family protein